MSEREEKVPDGGTDGTGTSVGDAATSGRRRRGSRRAVRRGTERETVWGATSDDQGDHDSNDDRLRRDVPPHW